MTGVLNTPSSDAPATPEHDEPEGRRPQTIEPQAGASRPQASRTREERAASKGRTTGGEGDTLLGGRPGQWNSGAKRRQTDPARDGGTPRQTSTTPPDRGQRFSAEAHSTIGLRQEADFAGSDEHSAVRPTPHNGAGFTGPNGRSTLAAIAHTAPAESDEPTLASESAAAEARSREIRTIMDTALHHLDVDDRVTNEAIARLYKLLLTMPVIEQAKGIIMATNHCAPDEAFDILRRASQRTNVKVRVLAQQIVARTVSGECCFAGGRAGTSAGTGRP